MKQDPHIEYYKAAETLYKQGLLDYWTYHWIKVNASAQTGYEALRQYLEG